MQLKNKKEREHFLENYTKWELWKEIPELELKFYRYILPNGMVIIATEYSCLRFADYIVKGCKYAKRRTVRYHLIQSDNDKYGVEYYETAHKFYNPAGDSKSDIITYFVATKPEIQEEMLL